MTDANPEAHASPTTTDAPGSDDGMWCAYRHLDEDFSIGETYATRQEAIDDYVNQYGAANGEHFQTGQLAFSRQMPACPISADDMFDRAADNASHEWSEGSIEQFNDACHGLTDELDAKLEALWEQFCEKHNLYFEGYTANDVEDHIVGEDESEEELARRKRERP